MRSALSWIWTHTAAAVALLAIILAFAFGYRTGRPATPREAPSASALDTAAPGEPQLYTCSMHPAVRLPDPRAKCPICFMDLIPVAADEDGEGSERRIVMSVAAAAQSRIETAHVSRFFPSAEVRLFGKMTYDETSVARLTAYFPGRIERLFVNYLGVPVQRGEHMAELYSPTLLTALEELRQAQSAGARAGGASELLQRATSDTLHAAREKLRLFGLTDAQIAAVEDGSFDSDRLTIYAPIGGVVTHLAVREGDYVQTGAPLATVADLSRLWLELEAYESQLPLLRWGQPVRFTVEARPGEIFEGQISYIEPLVKDRTRTAAVRVAVDNSDRLLKPGMFASALVRTPVAEGGAVIGDELAGRWVSPMHPSIVRDGPGACDICGMDLVPAESLGVVGDPTAISEPLVVPRTAVLFTGKRSVVYVAVADAERPTYEGREVLLGPRAGEFYTVREGLREGEAVVVHGAFRIDSAMQIAAKPSMMSPTGGESGAGAHAGHGARARARPGEGSAPAGAPEAFLSSLQPLFSAYLEAGGHLASDDLGGFLTANADLQAALASVREVGLVGEHLAAWRRAASQLRLEMTITDIEEARARFAAASEGILALVRRFGHPGGEALHMAHCPMAFDDRGADWLQRGTQIANPYFGASMLRCGVIRTSFEPIGAHGEHDGE